MTTPRRLVAVLTLTVLLAGCGSDGDGDKDKDGDQIKAEQKPVACAATAKAVATPADFPSGFPLPSTTIVTAVEERTGGQAIVTAVDPQPFKTVLKHFQTALPAAGITPSEGEVEEHDAESNFTASSYRGRWQLRELTQCDGQTQITVLTAPLAGGSSPSA